MMRSIPPGSSATPQTSGCLAVRGRGVSGFSEYAQEGCANPSCGSAAEGNTGGKKKNGDENPGGDGVPVNNNEATARSSDDDAAVPDPRFVAVWSNRGLQLFRLDITGPISEKNLHLSLRHSHDYTTFYGQPQSPVEPNGLPLLSLLSLTQALKTCSSLPDTVGLATCRAFLPQALIPPLGQERAWRQLTLLADNGAGACGDRGLPYDPNTYGLVTKGGVPKCFKSFAEWFHTRTCESMAQLRCIVEFVPMDLASCAAAAAPRGLKGYYTAAYDDATMGGFCVLVGQIPNVMTSLQVAGIVAKITQRAVVRVDMVPSCGAVKVWFASDADAEYAVSLTQTAMMTQGGALLGDRPTPEAAAETRKHLVVARVFVDMYVQDELRDKSDHTEKRVHDFAVNMWAAHQAQEAKKAEAKKTGVTRSVLGQMPITLCRGHGRSKTTPFCPGSLDFELVERLDGAPIAGAA